MTVSTTREDRYWAKVDRRGTDECWPWTGFRNPAGYGMFRGGSEQLAHRFGFALANGEGAGDLCVCHHCDNPACQNPSHFFLGTATENHEDKVRKGRQARSMGRPGAVNSMAKLTDDDVVKIRRLYASGDRTQAEIAAEFGVGRGAVGAIVRADKWKEGAAPIDRSRHRATGMRNVNAKMTSEQVAEARARYAAGGVSQQALADEYGISQPSMSLILRGKTRVNG